MRAALSVMTMLLVSCAAFGGAPAVIALPEATTVLSVTTLDAEGEFLHTVDMGLSP